MCMHQRQKGINLYGWQERGWNLRILIQFSLNFPPLIISRPSGLMQINVKEISSLHNDVCKNSRTSHVQKSAAVGAWECEKITMKILKHTLFIKIPKNITIKRFALFYLVVIFLQIIRSRMCFGYNMKIPHQILKC